MRKLPQAEGVERVDREDDALGVDRRVFGAERLDADLGEVPVTPGLRPLVAVVGAGVPELHRQLTGVQPVLERGTQHRRPCPPGAA